MCIIKNPRNISESAKKILTNTFQLKILVYGTGWACGRMASSSPDWPPSFASVSWSGASSSCCWARTRAPSVASCSWSPPSASWPSWAGGLRRGCACRHCSACCWWAWRPRTSDSSLSTASTCRWLPTSAGWLWSSSSSEPVSISTRTPRGSSSAPSWSWALDPGSSSAAWWRSSPTFC